MPLRAHDTQEEKQLAGGCDGQAAPRGEVRVRAGTLLSTGNTEGEGPEDRGVGEGGPAVGAACDRAEGREGVHRTEAGQGWRKPSASRARLKAALLSQQAVRSGAKEQHSSPWLFDSGKLTSKMRRATHLGVAGILQEQEAGAGNK